MKETVTLLDGKKVDILVKDKINIIERNKILSDCTKTHMEGNRIITETDLFKLQTLTLQHIISGAKLEDIDPDDCDRIFEKQKGIFGLTSEANKKKG